MTVLPVVSSVILLGCAVVSAQVQREPSTDWQVAKRGPHYRVMQREEVVDLGNGQVQRIPHQYVELATGLNYFDDASGQWQESRAEFDITPQGYAVARHSQHKVIISPILNDTRGAVDMETPDGRRMRSTILGLVLRDRVTGNNSLVAEIKDGVVGRKVGPNQIVFEDCFDDLRADVIFTVERGGFHQDVHLKEKLNPDWLEQNGFNAKTTRLEIWTEFMESPRPKARRRVLSSVKDPQLRSRMTEPDVVEEDLDFGSMKMPLGRAYERGTKGRIRRSVEVPKQWVEISGRKFLVESVDLAELEKLIASLPDWKGSGQSEARPLYADRRPPQPRLTLPGTNSVLTASLNSVSATEQPAVVLDYAAINGSVTNLVLQGDMTYYVSGALNVYGDFTIEGGTVVKFNPTNYSSINVYPENVHCKTGPYRPAIFTSMHDNTVGENVSGSTGQPYIDDQSFYLNFFNADLDLRNLRMYYSYDPLNVFYSSLLLRDSQFVHNDYPFWFVDTSPCVLENVLVSHTTSDVFYTGGSDVSASHMTINDAASLWYIDWTSSLALTNCLLVGVDSLGNGTPVTNAVVQLASGATPFETVGGGSFYLAANSPYRNAGTANISPELLADLQQKTTYPPLVHSNQTFNTSATFTPQAGRDTDTPDLGYHYDPLDHVIGGCDLSADLTVTAGTVVGWFEKTGGVYSYGQPYALSLQNGANISFEGTAAEPTWFVRFSQVQEGNGNLPWRGWIGGLMIYGTSSPVPQLNANFTKWSTSAGFGAFFRDVWKYGEARISNSEFYGASMQAYGADFYYTNCLFYRPLFLISGDTISTDVTWRNCTFYNGAMLLKRYSTKGTSSWWIENSAFDGTSIITYDQYNANTNYTYMDYNCFNSSNSSWMTHPYNWNTPKTNVLEVAGPNDTTVTDYEWQSGPLGDFYVGAANPVDAGSTHAQLPGLYHYTTQTDQAKETNSVVDIGYHYLAVDGNGVPLDTDSDGTPDYLDDDSDDDSLPDAWELLHFGELSQGPSDNPDLDNWDNATELANGTDPNTIKFVTRFDNLYVNTTNPLVEFEVQVGDPGEMAVLVNTTNLTANDWQPYSSPATVRLEPTDGDQDVWVVLRGQAGDASEAIWDYTELTLDQVPPALLITNPVTATVIKPYLQLQGCADEVLASVSYDLTNDVVWLTNESVAVVDQDFDTNRFDFTTNWFQGYDIELTNGLNTITLHAVDRAGNVATTNIEVTLDYSTATNPPVLQILWPPADVEVSGDTFYIRGRINDETGTVVAQQVDGNGVTNTVEGIVERNGMFWVENLPLAAGANDWELIATDAAGNVTSTNLSVVQSTMTLTITSTPVGDSLYEPSGMVYGTVSDPTYTVTVNGVAATVDGSGNWTAENVPNYGQGTATFDAMAAPSGGGGGGGSGTSSVADSLTVEMSPYVGVVEHHVNKSSKTWIDWSGELYTEHRWTKDYSAHYEPTQTGEWQRNYSATANLHDYYIFGYTRDIKYQWSGSEPVGTYDKTVDGDHSTGSIVEDPYGDYGEKIKSVPDLSLSENGPWSWYWITHYFGKGVYHEWSNPDGYDGESSATARTEYKLYTGGKASVGSKSLFDIYAWAHEYGKPEYVPESFYAWFNTPADSVPYDRIQVMGETPDAQGYIHKVLADNTAPDITVTVKGAKHANSAPGPLKHRLFITANGGQLEPDKSVSGAQFLVGQKVTFGTEWDSAPQGVDDTKTTYKWKLPGTYVNKSTTDPCETCSIDYFEEKSLLTTAAPWAWWVTGGDGDENKPGKILTVEVTVTLTFLNGKKEEVPAKGQFQMYRPMPTVFARCDGDVAADNDYGKPGESGLALHFGTWDTSSGHLECGYRLHMDNAPLEYNMPNLKATYGKYTCTQVGVVHVEKTYQGGTCTEANHSGLDREPLMNGKESENKVSDVWWDSPGSYYTSGVTFMSRNDSYTTFFMFTPKSGGTYNPQDIAVPMYKVTWGWSGAAPAEVTSNAGSSTGPTREKTTEFPHWNDVIPAPFNYEPCSE